MSSITKTYISVIYCEKCDKYSKSVARCKPTICSDCGSERHWKSIEKYSEKDPNNRGNFCNWSGMMKENVRYSVSLGVSETQIDEARKAHPGVEWKRFGHSFRPKIRNRQEKLRIMKQAKMIEYN